MAIDKELLNLAKSGPGDEAFQAANEMLDAAWETAYSGSSKHYDSRHSIDEIAEDLMNIVADLERFKDEYSLDRVRKNGKDSLIKLFSRAWKAAHNTGDRAFIEERLYRPILDELFRIANERRDSDDDEAFPQEQSRDDIPTL